MVEAFRADDKAVSLRTKLWFGIGASGEAATNWIFTVLTFYAYSFDWGGTRVRGDTIGFLYNATHALEIPFFHGSADQQSAYLEFGIFKGFTKENYESRKLLTDAMVAYLAGFAGTGNPNGEAPLPEWKPWLNEDGGSKVIHLDADLRQLDIHQIMWKSPKKKYGATWTRKTMRRGEISWGCVCTTGSRERQIAAAAFTLHYEPRPR